jgi:hypothetical protein
VFAGDWLSLFFFFCCLLTSVAEDSVEIFRVSTIIGMREKLECAPEINPGFMLHK